MKDINIATIEAILYNLYKDKQAPIHKSDVDSCESLPSYNTCVRRGLSLSELNRKFAESDYLDNPAKCLHCSVIFSYKDRGKKFCNNSCSCRYYNANKSLNGKSGKYDTTCLFCNETIEKAYKERKYCSHSCHRNH